MTFVEFFLLTFLLLGVALGNANLLRHENNHEAGQRRGGGGSHRHLAVNKSSDNRALSVTDVFRGTSVQTEKQGKFHVTNFVSSAKARGFSSRLLPNCKK